MEQRGRGPGKFQPVEMRVDRIEADPCCDRYWVYYTEWAMTESGILLPIKRVAELDALDLLVHDTPLNRLVRGTMRKVGHVTSAERRAEAEAKAAVAKAEAEAKELENAVIDELPL